MGKYMRKGRAVGKLAVIEEALGVRTRARALALQRDLKQENSTEAVTHTSTSSGSTKQLETCPSLECHVPAFPSQGVKMPTDSDYMELRSRRFEKTSRYSFARVGQEASNACLQAENMVLQHHTSNCSNSDDESSKVHFSQHTSFVRPEVGIRARVRQVTLQSSAIDAGGNMSRHVTPTASTGDSVSLSRRQPGGILTRHQRQALASSVSQEHMEAEVEVGVLKRDVDMNAEAEQFFGESPMIAGPSNKNRHRRRTRESTPDSYAWSMEAPGSTSRTRRAGRSQGRSLSAPPFNRANAPPTANEIEAFFQSAEQQERRKFIERYNFDPVSGRPLRGRFEWTST